MQVQRQRLVGVVVAIASALLFIYGAFYYPSHRAAEGWNWPLWLGVVGMIAGGALLVHGSRHTPPPDELDT